MFDACNIYPHQARTNANDKVTVKDYTFFTKYYEQRKILKYKVCRVVDPSKKVPDLNCEVQDLLLEVVDLKREGSCQFNPFLRAKPKAACESHSLSLAVTSSILSLCNNDVIHKTGST